MKFVSDSEGRIFADHVVEHLVVLAGAAIHAALLHRIQVLSVVVLDAAPEADRAD